jgi:hypothetical protein
MNRGRRLYGEDRRLVERDAFSREPEECPGVALPVDELAPCAQAISAIRLITWFMTSASC